MRAEFPPFAVLQHRFRGLEGLADTGEEGVPCRSVLTDRPFKFPILSSEAYSFGASHFLVCGDPVDQRTARLTCSAAGGTLGYPASTEDWYLIVYTTYWQEHAWSGYSAWWADPGYGGCQALAPASWSSTAVDCSAKLPVLCRVP